MKSLLSWLVALALSLSAGCALAQALDAQHPISNADGNPAETKPADTKPGHYWGTDTDGKRVEVQAPYGGKSQAEADAKEREATERLNQQALQAAAPATLNQAP